MRRQDAAQSALDRVPPKLDAAEAHVRALQTAGLRATLVDYMRVRRRTVTAFDHANARQEKALDPAIPLPVGG